MLQYLVRWNVLYFKCYLFFLAFPSHLPPIISPPSLFSPTFSVILILALQLYIFLSSHFLVFSSLLSSLPIFPQPSPLSLHQLFSFCLNPSPLLKPLIFFYGLVQPSPDLPVCLFLFFFFLLYPAPFILLPFASSPPPPIPPCLVSSVVHWLLIALWSWNATLTLSRPATESYWLEVWFKETTRDFFQGLLNLSSQLRLEYRLFTNLDKVWISCKRSRKVTICLS